MSRIDHGQTDPISTSSAHLSDVQCLVGLVILPNKATLHQGETRMVGWYQALGSQWCVSPFLAFSFSQDVKVTSENRVLGADLWHSHMGDGKKKKEPNPFWKLQPHCDITLFRQVLISDHHTHQEQKLLSQPCPPNVSPLPVSKNNWDKLEQKSAAIMRLPWPTAGRTLP